MSSIRVDVNDRVGLHSRDTAPKQGLPIGSMMTRQERAAIVAALAIANTTTRPFPNT